MYSCGYYNPWRAAEFLSRTLAVDPDYQLAYYCAALSHALIGHTSKAMQWLDQWETEQPGYAQEIRAWTVAFQGDTQEAARICPSTATFLTDKHRSVFAILTFDWDLARKLVKLEPGTGWFGAYGLLNRGTFDAYRGEFDRAVEACREAAALTTFEGHEGLQGGLPATVHVALAEPLDLKGEPGPPRSEAQRALAIQPENPMCPYIAGLFALTAGEVAVATDHLRAVKTILAAARGVMGNVYRDTLQAEILLAEGNYNEALRLFEGAMASHKLVLDLPSTFSSSGTAIRDGLIRCYLALGEKEKAAEQMKALLDSGLERLNHPVIYVKTLYRLGLLEIERGDKVSARKYLESFLDHWGNADWDIPEVQEARKCLEATA